MPSWHACWWWEFKWTFFGCAVFLSLPTQPLSSNLVWTSALQSLQFFWDSQCKSFFFSSSGSPRRLNICYVNMLGQHGCGVILFSCTSCHISSNLTPWATLAHRKIFQVFLTLYWFPAWDWRSAWLPLQHTLDSHAYIDTEVNTPSHWVFVVIVVIASLLAHGLHFECQSPQPFSSFTLGWIFDIRLCFFFSEMLSPTQRNTAVFFHLLHLKVVTLTTGLGISAKSVGDIWKIKYLFAS